MSQRHQVAIGCDGAQVRGENWCNHSCDEVSSVWCYVGDIEITLRGTHAEIRKVLDTLHRQVNLAETALLVAREKEQAADHAEMDAAAAVKEAL